jgi:hypothetical protein
MSNRRNDEYGEILQVISEETKYFKQYEGKILDIGDELNKGRVKISVPELGWFLPTESPWVDAEYFGRGCIVPKVDDWVVVYFIAGNVNRPRYRSRTSALTGSTPGSYTGVNKKVLFDDSVTVIVYDDESKELSISGPAKITIKGDAIELNGNGKQFVTWSELNTALTTLCGLLANHVHPSNGTPSPSLAGLSCDISAAKTTTLKTGG